MHFIAYIWNITWYKSLTIRGKHIHWENFAKFTGSYRLRKAHVFCRQVGFDEPSTRMGIINPLSQGFTHTYIYIYMYI